MHGRALFVFFIVSVKRSRASGVGGRTRAKPFASWRLINIICRSSISWIGSSVQRASTATQIRLASRTEPPNATRSPSEEVRHVLWFKGNRRFFAGFVLAVRWQYPVSASRKLR